LAHACSQPDWLVQGGIPGAYYNRYYPNSTFPCQSDILALLSTWNTICSDTYAQACWVFWNEAPVGWSNS